MPLPSQNFFRDTLAPLLRPNNYELLLQWMKNNRLIANELLCVCGRPMAWSKCCRRSDKFVWICCHCKIEKSIRTSSIFAEVARIPLASVVEFIWKWSLGCKDSESVKNGLGSRPTISHLSRLLVDVCLERLSQSPIGRQGGPNAAAQVDESVFVKRKYNRGRVVKERWVLGITMTDHNPARSIFYVVENRRAGTIIPLIRRNLKRGTAITTDMARCYNSLPQYGYTHHTVNHSRHFVDPVTGATTNTVENQWMLAKRFLKGKRCDDPDTLQMYLFVYMWMQWFGWTHANGPFFQLISDIVLLFPV